MEHNHKVMATDLYETIIAGKSIVTVVSNKTNKRYTFMFRRASLTELDINSLKTISNRKEKQKAKLELEMTKPIFVNVQTSPDNSSSGTYVGTIFNNNRFSLTRKSKFKSDAKVVKTIKWIFNKIVNNQYEDIDNNIEIYHSGHCNRCGKLLTVPESIISGYGPVCGDITNRMIKLIRN